MDEEVLLSNIHNIHTTALDSDRIKKNLNLDTDDVVAYCKSKIINDNCKIGHVRIAINAYSYTIITAHTMKEN